MSALECTTLIYYCSPLRSFNATPANRHQLCLAVNLAMLTSHSHAHVSFTNIDEQSDNTTVNLAWKLPTSSQLDTTYDDLEWNYLTFRPETTIP